MTALNSQSPTENQNEKIIGSLRNEISELKSQLEKKDDRIASQDVILKQISGSHSAEVRAFEDLEGKLEDVIEMLRKRVSHGDILAHIKLKDSNEFQFRKLW
jgi:glutathione synthase/RimK-type ligase-like ATP-grasp enzyme